MATSGFKDKIVLITGGASGIGAALAEALTAQGAHVVVADVDAAQAAALVARLGRGEARAVDVRDAAAVEALFDEVMARHGRLDYVFNNAGVTVAGEFRDLSTTHIDRVLDVNLRGCVYVAHRAFRIMAAQGHGHLVNTASGYGLTPGAGNIPYVTTKFGVVGLSEALRIEGHDLNVRVSVVCPGFVRTAIIERLTAVGIEARDVVEGIPVKVVEPDHAARIILRGVARNAAVIRFPGYVTALMWFYRLLPGLFFRFGVHLARKMRKNRIARD